MLDATCFLVLFIEVCILQLLELFLRLGLALGFLLIFVISVLISSHFCVLIEHDVAILAHLLKDCLFIEQVFDIGHIEVASLKVLANEEVFAILHSFLHFTKFHELSCLSQALRLGDVFGLLALLGKLLGETLRVDVSQDGSHFFEVPICNHPIGLIKDEHINHGERVQQVGVHLVVHQLPKTTWCRHDDCRFVAEEPLLLLNRHATDDRGHFDLLLVLDWNDGLDHVFDLDGQLSRWTQHKASNTLEDVRAVPLLSLIPCYLLDAEIKNWDAEAKRFTLACPCSDDHVHVRLKVDETAGLDLGGVCKLVDDQAVSQGLDQLK